MVGDVKVGKSQILNRYIYNSFEHFYAGTLSVDFGLKRVKINDLLIHVQIWDIAGLKNFIGIAISYYFLSTIAICVIDINDERALIMAQKWITDIKNKAFLKNGDNIPIILLCNKVCNILYIFVETQSNR